MTFIDPDTGWFEIAEILAKTIMEMSQMLNNIWLSRYPRPNMIIFDNGSEFKKDFHYIFDDYGIKPKPTTIKSTGKCNLGKSTPSNRKYVEM